ncbi:MAG: hypothetical protein PWQ55_1978 [Chloroflexota bacterium]|nr:hypothetical protein [Chloroflexota bacterium]
MKRSTIISILFAAMLVSVACTITINGGQDEPTAGAPTVIIVPTASAESMAPPEPVAEVTPTRDQLMPGEPSGSQGQIEDADSSRSASDKRVLSGDSYLSNFYERPFTEDEMLYLPDVDIIEASFTSDADFFYVNIDLQGLNQETNDLIASYGVELDVDTDGRGDYSVWALNPSGTTWTTQDVSVLRDSNNDVGGPDAYISDAPWQGNGYDETVDNTGREAAWVRVSPYDDTIVQIAVNRNLVGDPEELLWGVWADNGPQSPQQFDYDDTYTYRQAGSPISGNQYYPLASVHSVDNTCRRPWNFSPGRRIANMCWSAPSPTAEPEETGQPQQQPTEIILF